MGARGKKQADSGDGPSFHLETRWEVGPPTAKWDELWRRILTDVLIHNNPARSPQGGNPQGVEKWINDDEEEKLQYRSNTSGGRAIHGHSAGCPFAQWRYFRVSPG